MQGSRSMRPQGLLWSWKLQTLQADTTWTSWREQCLFSWTASLTNTESTNVLDKDTYVSRKIILSFLSLLSLSFVGILLLHFFCIFNWNIVALHCCVTFYWSMKWISYMYTYILSLLDLPPTLSHPTHLGHHTFPCNYPWILLEEKVFKKCTFLSIYFSRSSSHLTGNTWTAIFLYAKYHI